MKLGPEDLQCIAFLAQRRGVAPAVVLQAYVRAKRRFGRPGYKALLAQVHVLMAPLYGRSSEQELIASYQQHGLLHLYRHVSYSYWKLAQYEQQAQAVLGLARPGPLEIVDYGCGLGYISAAMARAWPGTTTYLVDVDGLVLDFAAFRFREMGLNCWTIPVTQDCVYPELPAHDVCIVTEAWEHLQRPMVAYERIVAALAPGGLLVGKMGDHGRSFFHVSPDLAELRARAATDFEVVGHDGLAIRRRTCR